MKNWVVVASLGMLLLRSASAQTELVVNGGFESNTVAPWQFIQTVPGANAVNDPLHARTGSSFLSLGTAGNADQVVYQVLSIPTNAVFAALSFYWNVGSGDSSDALTVSIRNTNHVALTNVAAISGNNVDLFYHPVAFDMKPFVGQTIEIYFRLVTVAISTFRIDDVSLVSATAADFPVNDDFTNRLVLPSTNSLLARATNALATKEPGEPNHANNAGGKSLWWSWTPPTNGIVTITTAGSSFDTLLAVYSGSTVSNLTKIAANDDDTSDPRVPLTTSRVKFPAAVGVPYQIAVDGFAGAFGLVVLNLSFQPDTKPPTASITSPAANAKLTNSTVMVQGKAADDLGVALVQIRLENAAGTNDYESATGTNTWSATVTNLIPGLNTVRVRAFDTSGNVSATVTRSFNYVIVSPLTLTFSGNGTVTPNLNGQLLQVGAKFTVTAKPGAGAIFAGWTGDTNASTAALTFTMQSNFVLQANFIANPFIPVAGNFQGLFFDTNGVENQSSGFLSLKLASGGSFSAKVQPAGKGYGFSGQFSAEGTYSNLVPVKGSGPISVQLQLDFANARVSGHLVHSNWTAESTADRVIYSKLNPAPQAGKYTVMLPGSDDAANLPGGDSIGSATVDASGNVKFAGTLGDGTKVSQKAALAGQGEWAFFLPLYKGQGSALGWLTFTNEAASDLRGAVTWIKLPQATAFYPGGFTNDLELIGSAYQFSIGIPVLNVSTGQVWFANGNLPQSFTNLVTLSAASKISNLSTNPLTLTITTTSGLLKGKATDPASGRVLTLNGVLLQKLNEGRGFFPGTNQTGRLFFGP